MKKSNTILIDEITGNKIPCSISSLNGKIYIKFKGYGDCSSKDGYGEPIVIDYFNDTLKVLVWSDINKEDPTFSINLEGAKESNRKL